LLALVAGALGLRAILRRRARPAPATSPAAELKAKLAATKEPEPEPEPASVDERRADVHARARQAIEELRKNSD
jgi:broad specificity phosphatase PhoE